MWAVIDNKEENKKNKEKHAKNNQKQDSRADRREEIKNLFRPNKKRENLKELRNDSKYFNLIFN